MRARIEAFARELNEELAEVDDSMGVCWLDAVEHRALEIGDALPAELMKQPSTTPQPLALPAVLPNRRLKTNRDLHPPASSGGEQAQQR